MIEFALEGDGILLTADGTESKVIADLAGQLDGMLAARIGSGSPATGPGPRSLPDDPALARLLPDMIAGDAESAAELRALVEPSLLVHKRENARLVIASLAHPGMLDPVTEEAWVRLLTDLRLTIGARLGINDDRHGDDGIDPAATGTERTLHEVSAWLGGVLEHLISVLDARDDARDDTQAPV